MSNQSLFLRVPVLVFAILVGSIYVYARSGGRFFTTPAQVTPAAQNDPHEAASSLMMGSKSAPAFLPEEPAAPQSEPAYGQPTLLPGSKSEAVIRPNTVQSVPALGPPTNLGPTNDLPNQAPAPRLLPGSKSVILADPPRLTPPPPQPQQALQPAPNRGLKP